MEILVYKVYTTCPQYYCSSDDLSEEYRHLNLGYPSRFNAALHEGVTIALVGGHSCAVPTRRALSEVSFTSSTPLEIIQESIRPRLVGRRDARIIQEKRKDEEYGSVFHLLNGRS